MALRLALQENNLRKISHCRTALAIVAAANNELEVSKSLLFEVVSDPTLCPRALFVLCAAGINQKSDVLAKAALGKFTMALNQS